MDYLTEIDAFYDRLETNPLPVSAIALWHALLHTAVKAGRTELFAVALSVLSVKTGLPRRTLYNARNALKGAGLINFEKRAGNRSAVYSIIPCCQWHGAHDGTQHGTHDGTQHGTHDGTPCISSREDMLKAIMKAQGEKEAEKEKESSPHTPFKERAREEEKEALNKRAGDFRPPTPDEVAAYCQERGSAIDPGQFIDFYASKGWMVGKNKMRDWRAAIRTWERRERTAPAAREQESFLTMLGLEEKEEVIDL